MLVSDVIRQVARTFGDTDQIFITDQDYFDWINAAQREIVEKTECSLFTFPATASTYPIVAPTDMYKVRRVLYGTQVLNEIAIEKLDSVGVDLSVRTAGPMYYYFRGSSVNLYPLQPNGDTTQVSFEYVQYYADVAATGASILTPKVYDTDIISYVLGKAHERNENQAGYNQAMNRFNSNVSDDGDSSFNKSTTYPIIGDDPYEEW